ncbi:hypothetical protein [Xylanimonas ulmi]|uniref:Uncharacterized protein n=1 Tax=Xylanimonas ulmi TaxID=228973 RepID=A0A4V2EYC0_9MICO|nr:hypothetical protein [Xylanibacterium ulmi]RZS62460.1 hypothetical protein EV386_2793 [Xylanibacterium ulmi]
MGQLRRCGRDGGRTTLIGVVAVSALLLAGVPTATAATPGTAPAPVAAQGEEVIGSGPSGDSEAIAAAAEGYESGDLAAAAELANSASAVTAVRLGESASHDETATAATDAGTVRVSADGRVTADAETGLSLTVDLGASATDVHLVGGAVVASEVAPSTDIVTRATGDGVQLVAILADADAPNEVAFPLGLPDDADLVQQADGSISVFADVPTQEASPEDLERLTAEIDSIIGDADSEDDLSDAQWKQIAQLAPAEVTTTVARRQVATIEPAWALDAHGEHVESHYEVTASGVVQVIDTDAHTAFPVTADPNWVWWTWTSAQCVANLATIVFGAAKLANVAVKIGSLVKKSAALSRAVKRIGGGAALMKSIYFAAKGFVEGRIGKYLTRTQYLVLSGMASATLDLIGDALGVGSCVSLVKEMM